MIQLGKVYRSEDAAQKRKKINGEAFRDLSPGVGETAKRILETGTGEESKKKLIKLMGKEDAKRLLRRVR